MVLLLGIWLFEVPVRGSVLDVYLAAVLLILANLTLGLLISTKAQSQFQAMQMTFFVFLPSILLSGFMFPFAGMPRVVQWIAEVLPLTHFLRLIRGVMLRGAGSVRVVAGRTGAAGLHRGDDDCGDPALPQAAGLIAARLVLMANAVVGAAYSRESFVACRQELGRAPTRPRSELLIASVTSTSTNCPTRRGSPAKFT